MNRIAVIVPVYKVERYLDRCVRSILEQTFREFDLILVDDGSPDRCGDFCEEYARHDNRVSVIHKSNGGLASARNAGIAMAMKLETVDYVTFIDSDDWVDKCYLSVLMEGLSRGTDVVSVGFARVSDCGVRYVQYRDEGWHVWSAENYWVGAVTNSQICAWGKLYRKSLFAGIEYPEGRLMEDAFTTPRLIFKAQNVAHREIPLYNYYTGSSSIMRSSWSPRKLDEVDAYRWQIAFFREVGCSRAESYAHRGLWAAMASMIEPLRDYDVGLAENFQRAILSSIRTGKMPFWENRSVYRRLNVRFYSLRWLAAMFCDFLSEGRRSWLVREAPALAVYVTRQLLMRKGRRKRTVL